MTRRNPRTDSVKFDLVNDRHAIDAVRDQIVEALGRLGYSDTSAFAVRLAFEEAISNAFRHGHRGLPDSTPVGVEYRIGPDEVEITLQDRGPGFVPSNVPDPTLEENLELPSGRGLMLIRAYMSGIEFNPAGNRIRMIYRKPDPS
jgi:serine/threonine-protein kinase RsbW